MAVENTRDVGEVSFFALCDLAIAFRVNSLVAKQGALAGAERNRSAKLFGLSSVMPFSIVSVDEFRRTIDFSL